MLGSSAHVQVPKPVKTNLTQVNQWKWTKQGSGFYESQTFYIFPTTGGMIYLQLAYSEISYPHVSQVSLRIKTPTYTGNHGYSYSGSALKCHDHGLHCQSFKIQPSLKDGKPVYHVCFSEKHVELDLQFDFTDALVQVDDGKVEFSAKPHGKVDAFVAQHYGCRANVRGTLTVDSTVVDVTGLGSMNLQYQSVAPHKLATLWKFTTVHSETMSLSTIGGITPSTYGHEPFATLVLQIGSEQHVATQSELKILETEVDPSTGYAVPKKVELLAHWTTEAQDRMRLSCQMELNPIQYQKIDVLAELPWLVRKAIQILVSKPYVYFQPIDTVLQVTKNDEPVLQEQGVGLVEFTFTN